MKDNTRFADGRKFFLSKALIVEGSEDRNFIINFLRHLGIDKKIYVHEVGGSGNLASNEERSLKLAAEQYDFKKNVKILAILFDGDAKKKQVLDEIRKSILKINDNFEELRFYLSDDLNLIDCDFQLPKKRKQKDFEKRSFCFLFKKILKRDF